MAQGRSTKIISMIQWIRTSRLATKESLSPDLPRKYFTLHTLGTQPRVKPLRSGDTHPCRMTGVTLPGVVFPHTHRATTKFRECYTQLVRYHEEIRCSVLGPTHNRISPSVLYYTKITQADTVGDTVGTKGGPAENFWNVDQLGVPIHLGNAWHSTHRATKIFRGQPRLVR
jgi:hypothetical protein